MLRWAKTYGGANYDDARSIQQTSDGEYIVAGNTKSFGAGDYDIWVLKFDSNGAIVFNPTSGASTRNTNATVTNTSATITDTNVTVTDTSATIINTTIVSQDTNATIQQQAP